LHHACLSGNTDTVAALLAAGANLEARAKSLRRPLHVAALMAPGEDEAAAGVAGRPPPAKHGASAVVAVLLAAGADAGARDRGGWTALHLAAQAGRVDVVETILAHAASMGCGGVGGCGIGDRGGDRRSPVHAVARPADEGDYYLNRYQDDDGDDNDDDLMSVSASAVSSSSLSALWGIVDAADLDGNTALRLALREGHEAVARLLLAHGADRDAPSRHGNTALHAAAFRSLPESVQLLLDLGANRHAKVREGKATHRTYTRARTASISGVSGWLEERRVR